METAALKRPAVDIEEDIREFIRSYDPVKQAVHHFSYTVDDDGHVVLTGNVRSVQARRVLVDNIPDIPGVISLDNRAFFDDETLRLEVGKLLPRGVMTRVNFGHATLYGMMPEGANLDDVMAAVKNHPGIHGVDTQFQEITA